MSSPFFTIVIPTLNEAVYIPKLLTALKTQTCADFEVIVVDGQSTDHTAAVVTHFPAGFTLRLIKHRVSNVGEQRNRGASAARGEYLLFFDADVTIEPDFLAKLKKILEVGKIDFASPFVILDTKRWSDHIFARTINSSMLILSLVGRPLMSGQSLVVKKKVFDLLGGFDPTVVHAEDGELAQRAAKHHFRGKILSQLAVRVSARRFEREGRIALMSKYLWANLYLVLRGPIRVPLFNYKMGGEKS